MSHQDTKTTSGTNYSVSLVNFNEIISSSVSNKSELLNTVVILILIRIVFVIYY